jgi:NADPH2:quinone reductase
MMRAAQIFAPGDKDVIEVVEISRPSPGTGEVLVKNSWAGINYIDIYQRTGRYPLEYPVTLGLEGSGVVAEIGQGVTSVAIGDRVAWGWAQGSYAEYTIVKQEKVAIVPDEMSLEMACAIMMQGLTAHYLITSVYKAEKEDVALVHAAAGGVGLILCQMLNSRGLTVVGTVSSIEKEKLAKDAGAHHVIRYDKTDFQAEIETITSGKKCHVVFDGVGASTFEGSLKSLKPRGTLALFGAASGPVPPFDLQRLSGLGSLIVTRPTLAHFIQTEDELRWRCSELFSEVLNKELAIAISGTYELEDVRQAHHDIESRTTSGKLLLKIS